MDRCVENYVNANLSEYWAEFGYQKFGLCFTDSSNFVYVPIPKNASSETSTKLLSLGWSANNFSENISAFKDYKFIVILRDPIDRWLSGINQYFLLYHKTIYQLSTDTLNLIAHKIVLDDHTEKQIYFCNKLNLDKTIFFKFGPNLNKSLNDYFSKYYNTQIFDFQKKEDNLRLLQHQLIKLLDKKLQDRLYSFYWQDYELINKVNFYNA